MLIRRLTGIELYLLAGVIQLVLKLRSLNYRVIGPSQDCIMMVSLKFSPFQNSIRIQPSFHSKMA